MRKKVRLQVPIPFSFLFFFFLTLTAAAQQRVVKGTVISSEDNRPIVGATVTAKGTSIATQTDANGAFSLSVPGSVTTLTISYVGYQTQDAAIGVDNTVLVTLRGNAAALNAVVVTGYTTQRKKDIIGAVAVVDAEDLKSTPSANVVAQLQGRASGVTVSTTGDPGSSANIRIRGFASYGNNNPLFVIDGVPTTDPSRLNPQDVESMQVLKDATSASIYGSRAANGVIIVTTKHGRANRTSVTYDAYAGIQAIPYNRIPQMLNTTELIQYLNLTTDASYVDPVFGQHGSFSIPDYYVVSKNFKGGVSASDPRANPSLYTIADYSNAYQIFKTSAGTDWFRAMSQKGVIQSHQLTASGGTDKSTYSLGLNYFNQDGVFRYTGYNRYSVRVNSSFKPTSYLTFGENVQVAYDNRKGDNNIIGEQSAWANAYRSSPFIPVYDINGGFGGSLIGGTAGVGWNPVAYLYRRKDWTNNSLRAFGNVFGEINIIKGLTARTSLGIDAGYGALKQALLREYERTEPRSITQLTEGSFSFSSWTWTNTLNFQRRFGDHDVKLLAGIEAIENTSRGIAASKSRYDFENDNFLSLNTGLPASLGDISATNTNIASTSLFSYFGRLDYTLKNRYLLNATLRRDGASVFGPQSRYGNFPSVGLGWRMSDEDFLKNINWITDLKLRGGWGQMGSISNVPAANQYSTFTSNPTLNFYDINAGTTGSTQGFGVSTQGNQKTKWETTETINLGLDATLLQGRWSFSVDVYQKDTKDLLVPQLRNGLEPLIGKPLINLGTMRNRGIDLQLNNNGKITKDLRYDVALTFTHYKNKLTKLNEENTQQILPAGRLNNVLLTAQGYPVSSFYGYQIDGFYNTADDVAKGPKIGGASGQIGTWKYKDVDGDNNITPADRVILGSPHPDFQMGLNIGLNWKAFDFSAFLFWNQGNEIFNYTKYFTYMGVLGGGVAEGKLTDAWTPQTAGSAKTPALGAGAASGYTSFVTGNPLSFYVEDGSYLRAKNLQLGYSLPNGLLSRAKISSARIYVQAQNLFTITKYTGADPDLGLISTGQVPGGTPSDQTIGVDLAGFPSPKQFLFGLNVSF